MSRVTTEAIALDVTMERDVWRALVDTVFSDAEAISLLMWLHGHDAAAIARVLPRRDGRAGVARQRVHQVLRAALGKLEVTSGIPVANLNTRHDSRSVYAAPRRRRSA